jgi:hypothetical protein
MKTNNLLCLAIVIFISSVCLASGESIVQSASNTADVGGYGNSVSQSNTQNAQNAFGGGSITQGASNSANVGALAMVVPTGSLQERIWDGGEWRLTAGVCLGETRNTSIYNDLDQNLMTYELYPNGQVVVSNPSYHLAGEMVYGEFTADTAGEYKIGTIGSVSGWSPDIITVQVVQCEYIGPSTDGFISQGASNRAKVGGMGNTVDQSNTQNAFGFGSGKATQRASNKANVFGSGNRVNQGINQRVFGSGTTQSGGNRADISGTNNAVKQQINQKASGGGVTQSGGSYVHASGSNNEVSIKEDQTAIGNAVATSGGVSVDSQSN